MSTRHILPGYGDPVRRSKSAFPLELHAPRSASAQSLVQQVELDRIKDEARRMWTPIQREHTTYCDHFREKSLLAKSEYRPTSPTRRNNPHPKPVFLVNRLHYIPGYHNPDTTMGKPTYKIDVSIPPHLQDVRRQLREKYKARTSTSSVNQYRQKYNFVDFMDPVEAQAMDSWMTLAQDTESTDLSRVMDTIRSNPAKQTNYKDKFSQLVPQMTVIQMREADIDATGRVTVKRKPARGDFLIHPEWPPSMPHHGIPGF